MEDMSLYLIAVKTSKYSDKLILLVTKPSPFSIVSLWFYEAIQFSKSINISIPIINKTIPNKKLTFIFKKVTIWLIYIDLYMI